MSVCWSVFGSNYKVTFFPPVTAGSTCSSHQMTCSSGECIPKEYRCDHVRDCSDGTDEKDCSESLSVFALYLVSHFPFGILSNLLDLLMDRNAYNMPLVIEISWQILLWSRGDVLIEIYFYENFLSVSCLGT